MTRRMCLALLLLFVDCVFCLYVSDDSAYERAAITNAIRRLLYNFRFLFILHCYRHGFSPKSEPSR